MDVHLRKPSSKTSSIANLCRPSPDPFGVIQRKGSFDLLLPSTPESAFVVLLHFDEALQLPVQHVHLILAAVVRFGEGGSLSEHGHQTLLSRRCSSCHDEFAATAVDCFLVASYFCRHHLKHVPQLTVRLLYTAGVGKKSSVHSSTHQTDRPLLSHAFACQRREER